MEAESRLNFTLSISAIPVQGELRKWAIQSVNEGVPEELVLVYLQNWILAMERKCHVEFKKEHLL